MLAGVSSKVEEFPPGKESTLKGKNLLPRGFEPYLELVYDEKKSQKKNMFLKGIGAHMFQRKRKKG